MKALETEEVKVDVSPLSSVRNRKCEGCRANRTITRILPH
jgi:hypothetical protein